MQNQQELVLELNKVDNILNLMILCLGLYVAVFTLRQPRVWHELSKRITMAKASLTHETQRHAIKQFKKN